MEWRPLTGFRRYDDDYFVCRINWGDGPAESVPLDADGAEAATVGGLVNGGDADSMLEPPPTSSFKDVHSMDESSNVEMEMAF